MIDSRRDDALARDGIIERVVLHGQECSGIVRPSFRMNTGSIIPWLSVPWGCDVATLGST